MESRERAQSAGRGGGVIRRAVRGTTGEGVGADYFLPRDVVWSGAAGESEG